MSFIDGFSGYSQVKMYPEDKKHTSFKIPLGVYCYTETPFGLKNAGAIYQCAINIIFHEHMRKTVECYNIAVKSCDKGNHIADLKRILDIMRVHQLKMNPIKSFLGVASDKFLRFVITSKEIHLDLEKVHAIQEMQPSRNLKELSSCRDV